jgi:hypothetical protein
MQKSYGILTKTKKPHLGGAFQKKIIMKTANNQNRITKPL